MKFGFMILDSPLVLQYSRSSVRSDSGSIKILACPKGQAHRDCNALPHHALSPNFPPRLARVVKAEKSASGCHPQHF